MAYLRFRFISRAERRPPTSLTGIAMGPWSFSMDEMMSCLNWALAWYCWQMSAPAAGARPFPQKPTFEAVACPWSSVWRQLAQFEHWARS